MKTDDLVQLLATGLEPTPRGVPRRRLLRALAYSLPVAATAMWLLLGVQPDLVRVATTPMFWVKVGVPLALAGATGLALTRLGRPGAALGATPAVVALPLIFVLALAVWVLLRAAPDTRAALVLGESWNWCPWLIAGLALPTFVASLWALRGLAPTRLRLAGAAAGLFAGAVGAAVYAVHCPELAAPFVGTWYVLGMLLPTLLGAALGRRVLHWV